MPTALHHIKRIGLFCLAIGFILAGSTGCVSSSGYAKKKITTTPIKTASTEIPEEELLDIGIPPTEVPELTEKELKKQGTSEEIRRSEGHYIPYHLKSTLQNSSNWGAVRVVPAEADDTDLRIETELIESNGEHFHLRVKAVDATGKVWFKNQYEAVGTSPKYENNVQGQKEVYQNLYNRASNDLVAFKNRLTPEEIQRIRTAGQLRFAAEFAPDAFGDFISTDSKTGRIRSHRLPAENDPMWQRVMSIRERENMYVDTVNEYYAGYYQNMWDAYQNWRKFNLVERLAVRQVKKDSIVRTATGILLIAAAIALEVGDVDNTRTLSNIMVLGGGQVMISGINISKQAEMHQTAISELSESFSGEMKPMIVELEGKKFELSGTVNEQYAQWQDILRKIYSEETGFDPDLSTESEDARATATGSSTE